MLSSALGEGSTFNVLAAVEQLTGTTEEDIGWGEVVQRLVVTFLVVVLDKGSHRQFKLTREVMIFEADEVLKGAVIALNLALGHGMVRGTAGMANIGLLEELGQIVG